MGTQPDRMNNNVALNAKREDKRHVNHAADHNTAGPTNYIGCYI